MNIIISMEFYNACTEDHKELILSMIEKGTNDWDWGYGLAGACYGGHKELALLMIEKGADDWNWGLYEACEGGHKELVLLMIEKGANEWNWGLRSACNRGNKELAILMIEKGASTEYCRIPLTIYDYIYLFHKGRKIYDSKLEEYKIKKQVLISNYEDFWVKILVNSYL